MSYIICVPLMEYFHVSNYGNLWSSVIMFCMICNTVTAVLVSHNNYCRRSIKMYNTESCVLFRSSVHVAASIALW